MLATVLTAIIASGPCLSSADGILSANRIATGSSSPQAGTASSTYRYAGQGLTGNVVIIVDPATGSFVERATIGPTSTSRGFDGRTAWQSDLSGYSSPQEGGDELALAINEAYRLSNTWWRRDRGGATVSVIGCDELSVTPKGGQPFEARFDPATHLLASLSETQSFGAKFETTFSDYRSVGGMRVPFEIRQITNGDPANAERRSLTSRSDAARQPASSYSRPLAQPRDWSLPSGRQITVPFRLLNNHVVVEASVDGHGPYPFIVDTGGHDIVTPVTAQALSLVSQGSATSGGAGEKTVPGGYVRISRLAIGGAVLRDQTVLTLDFSPPAIEGIQLGGMIGAEFLERFVVAFDYGSKTLTLTDPAAFDAARKSDAGTVVPFRFYEHLPQIDGMVDGLPARFNIDTGSRSDITMTSPFVDAHHMRERYAGVTTTDGWGVGGPSRSLVTRADIVKMGDVVVAKPLISLSAAHAGSFSDASYDGNIGSGLLKRFRVTFDYAGRTMYLRRLRTVDPDVSQFDRTGMWINLASTGFEVVDLAPDGPAKAAGLAVGDVLTAISGTTLSGRQLSDVRRELKLLPIREPLSFEFLRSGSPLAVMLAPRDLVPK